MPRRIFRSLAAVLLVLGLTGTVLGMPGFGGGEEQAADETMKVRLKPLKEDSKVYGWVRISADQFSLGANHLQKDAVFSVYFVNASERKPVAEEAVVRSDDSGEAKYGARLTEPLGGQWDKVVLYLHPDGNPSNVEGIQPVLEGSLKE
ncbi:MAG: hypothetical protein HY319_29885 [Armatimonadetes bacterium]|nr:hypothetical protein [Armatimonadota bacterium]